MKSRRFKFQQLLGHLHDSSDDALQAQVDSPDGPCFDLVNRYVNCGNGTVTDTVTGLTWLQLANCFPIANWPDANAAAAGLQDGHCGLADGSSPGDWRLPTKDEWDTTIAAAVALGCTAPQGPSLTDDAGNKCLSDPTGAGSSFIGVWPSSTGDEHWSSTSTQNSAASFCAPGSACGWFARLQMGWLGWGAKFVHLRVWPVRSPHPH